MARPIKSPNSPDHQALIATAAEALFAERGFDGAPMREIAEQAGSTKALIYHYYRSKEALYLSLLETGVSEVVAQIERLAAAADEPEAKVRGVVRVFVEYYRAHPQRFQMVQRAVDEHSLAATTLAERWFSRVHQSLREIVREGIVQGIFRPLPIATLPFVVVSLILQALRTHKIIDHIEPDVSGAQLVDGLADLIVDLLKKERL
jgi:TetR/AcrR family transcriptional regulator